MGRGKGLLVGVGAATVAGTSVYISYKMAIWVVLQRRRFNNERVERRARFLLGAVDDVERLEIDVHGRARKREWSKSRNSITAELIWEVKYKFGSIPRNEANVLMVSKYVRDYLRERGVRPQDACAIYPFVVECSFIKYKFEIDAERMAVTRAAEYKKEEESLQKRAWPWWLGPFLRPRGDPQARFVIPGLGGGQAQIKDE